MSPYLLVFMRLATLGIVLLQLFTGRPDDTELIATLVLFQTVIMFEVAEKYLVVSKEKK